MWIQRLTCLLLWSLVPYTAAAVRCTTTDIEAILPKNATLNRIYSLSQGATFGQSPIANPEFPAPAVNAPASCVVYAKVNTSSTSSFNFGVILPDNWNGRFLMTGNGGFGGGVNVSPITQQHQLQFCD